MVLMLLIGWTTASLMSIPVLMRQNLCQVRSRVKTAKVQSLVLKSMKITMDLLNKMPSAIHQGIQIEKFCVIVPT